MNTKSSPIGVFDSGVGGLTILSELQKLLPKETFMYVADQKHAPYGKKTKREIEKRAITISDFLLSKNVKMIIIACNTATIASAAKLRKKYSIPIVGVVPVIKTAAQKTKTGNIAILATPSTCKSDYLTGLIRKFANKTTVHVDGATGLEELIEAGIILSPKIDYILQNHLKPLAEKNIDVIALGCTHYPFLKNEMQKVVGKHIQIIDSSGAVARRVQTILILENLLSSENNGDMYYTTGSKNHFENTIKILTGKKITAQEIQI